MSLCHEVIVTIRSNLQKWHVLTDFYGLRHAEIWKRTKFFVPLHCQKLSAAAATIKTKNCED